MTDLYSPLPCACLGHLTNTATMADRARGSSLTRRKRPRWPQGERAAENTRHKEKQGYDPHTFHLRAVDSLGELVCA